MIDPEIYEFEIDYADPVVRLNRLYERGQSGSIEWVEALCEALKGHITDRLVEIYEETNPDEN